MKQKNILILGGTGFVGEAIIDQAIKQGYHPTVLVRNATSVSNKWRDHVTLLEGDAQTWHTKLTSIKNTGFVATIYAIGLIRETKKATFLDAHYTWVQNWITAAKELQIPQLILISANGVKNYNHTIHNQSQAELYNQQKNNETAYQFTKRLGEVAVKQSGLTYTIFRPSIVWGKSEKYNFRNVLDSLTKARIVPILGNGKYKLSPIERQALAEQVVTSITSPEIKIKNVCGKEYTYKQLMQKVAHEEHRNCIYIHIPFFLILFVAKLLGRFPWFPVTHDQIIMLREGNTCSDVIL